MPRATSVTSAPDLLADVGDLVDEGDLRRQEGVRGELDHLGRGDVGAHDLAAQRAVDRLDLRRQPTPRRRRRRSRRDPGAGSPRPPCPPSGTPGTRRRRGRARRGGSRARCRRGRCSSSPARGRRRRAAARRRPARARGPRRPSRWAACPRSRTGAGRTSSTLRHLGREGQPLGVALQQLVDAGLVDRHLAPAQRPSILRRVDVHRDDLVAELGEARGGDEADPAHPDHADWSFAAHRRTYRRLVAMATRSARVLAASTRDREHLARGRATFSRVLSIQ